MPCRQRICQHGSSARIVGAGLSQPFGRLGRSQETTDQILQQIADDVSRQAHTPLYGKAATVGMGFDAAGKAGRALAMAPCKRKKPA